MARRMDWTRPAAPRYASLKAERPRTDIKDPEWVETAHNCLRGFRRLSKSEQRFLESILSILPPRLSQKQSAWLTAIAYKARA